MTQPKLELVSFDLCPYVQRSVITLKRKQVPYSITYIDLESPPDWFGEISPLGQVPVLRVGEGASRTTVFESAVINEYLDETAGTPLHPRDPLARAKERSWIEYGSSLIMGLYHLSTEREPPGLEEKLSEVFADLLHVERVTSEGPFFRGKDFGLVDAAYAPLFMRYQLADRLWKDPRWKQLPRVRRWAEALLALPEVRESVIPDFEQKYRGFLKERGSLL